MSRPLPLSAVVPALALVVAGFAAFGLAWLGLSTETVVAQQVAWVASGAMTGLGLITVGVVLAALRLRRHNTAVEIAALEEATRDAREIAALVRARPAA